MVLRRYIVRDITDAMVKFVPIILNYELYVGK